MPSTGLSRKVPANIRGRPPSPTRTRWQQRHCELWPEAAEPTYGFREKDQVENDLHNQVCAGSIGLLKAQRAIATSWLDMYQRMLTRAHATTTATAIPALAQPVSGVSITSIAGGRPGGRATATVQTQPGASCLITYATPAGTRSTAQGLSPKIADSKLVSWTWNIGSSTRPGTGTVTVVCNGSSTSSPIQIG